MARYTGPRTKKSRTFGEPIFGYDKAFEKRKYAQVSMEILEKKELNLSMQFS